MVKMFFIFLLLLETLTCLRTEKFIIIALETYLWINVYSLYEMLKIGDRVEIAKFEFEIVGN